MRTIHEVENELIYLASAASMSRDGRRSFDISSTYSDARGVMRGAEKKLRELGMYDTVENALNEGERLMLERRFDEADHLVMDVLNTLMRKRRRGADEHD